MDFPRLFLSLPLFDDLLGTHIEAARSSGPLLELETATGKNRQALVLQLHQQEQVFHLHEGESGLSDRLAFSDRRHDFSFLANQLIGATLTGAAVLRGQSLLRLDFISSGQFKEEIPLFLFVEFFGGGRLVLTDRDCRVIRGSRKGGEQHRPGAIYWPGSGALADPEADRPLDAAFFDDWPPEILARAASGGDIELPEESYRGLIGFSPCSARFLVERNEAVPIGEVPAVLSARLGQWLSAVAVGKQKTAVLAFPPGSPRICRLLPLEPLGPDRELLAEPGARLHLFDSYGEALAFRGVGCLSRSHIHEIIVDLRQTLSHRLRKSRKLVERLEAELASARDAPRLRRMADALAANLHRVRRGMSEIELEDLHNPGQMLTVALDPAREAKVNLDRLYRRAAKGERGQSTIEARLADARATMGEDEDLLGERLEGLLLEQCREDGNIDELRDALLDLRARLPRGRQEAGGKRGRAQERGSLFRRYELAGGWLALVGRSNRENDLLTHREAAPGDLWFHASGAAGSHVILRTGGHKGPPPPDVLTSAAALAAWFSKARNSNLVPVIYTERRYVRKPRKAPPGLAICTREKSVMVEPALPEKPAE